MPLFPLLIFNYNYQTKRSFMKKGIGMALLVVGIALI